VVLVLKVFLKVRDGIFNERFSKIKNVDKIKKPLKT